MRKSQAEKLIRMTIVGPVKNREEALKNLKKLGYSDVSDTVPWRDAFSEQNEGNEAGECLAGARHKEGLTQKVLSEKTGIPQRHISEMENGKRPIGKKAAKNFGEKLGVDYRVFL